MLNKVGMIIKMIVLYLDYIFTFKDFEKAIGYGSVSRGISDDKNFVGDLITIIKKHTRNTYLDARFHIRKDFETLLKKHEL